MIFNADTIFHNLCNEYKKTHDSTLKEKILNKYQNDEILRKLYSGMIKTDNPNIDSICKYKDLVFGPILID